MLIKLKYAKSLDCEGVYKVPAGGDPVPDFELPDQDGRLVHLSDFAGHRIVLFTFPKAGSMGCTMQACSFRDQFPRLEATNTVVLGLSADTPEELRAWKQRENLPYDLLSDPDYTVLNALGAGSTQVLGMTVIRVQRGVWIFDENGALVESKLSPWPRDSVNFALGVLKRMPMPSAS